MEFTRKSFLAKVPKKWNNSILNSNITNLNQDSVEPLVLSWGPTRAGVLPVDIQTIKLILTQECDHAADEGLTIGRSWNHSWEPGDRETVRALLAVLRVPLHDPRFITTYFWVPKFQPPMASRVFRLLFLQAATTAALSSLSECVYICTEVCFHVCYH